jgi:hypothetical protein
MSDDPYPCTQDNNFDLCKLILKTLLLTATTAAFAQEQKVPTIKSYVRSDRLTLTLGAENISALTIERDKTVFYNDLRPNLTARACNGRGDYAQLKAMEVLILEDKNFTPITSKFMLELGKLTGNGGTVIFKAGREKTEGAALFDHALEYYADSRDAYQMANSAERLVFGYQKNNKFIELGIIGKNGDGFFVIPNPKHADFWAKSGLTLLEKSGVKLNMSGAVRLGSKHKQLLSSIGISERSGFGAGFLGNYDFAEKKGNIGLRAWKDFQRGWRLIAETVFNQNRDLYIRNGADKGGIQFSVEYGKPKNRPNYFNFTVAANLARSRTVCGAK